MKRNMEVLTLNSTLLEQLTRCIGPELGPGGQELARALEELKNGTCETLMLSLGEHTGTAGESCVRCGDIAIYAGSRRVTRGGEEISLTPKEFDILYLLARNRGQVFTKEQIYQAVWDDAYFMDSSNIMAFIRKLRKKIEPEADAPRYILTVWGLGYKFSEKD